jgi:hypothetical protein
MEAGSNRRIGASKRLQGRENRAKKNLEVSFLKEEL